MDRTQFCNAYVDVYWTNIKKTLPTNMDMWALSQTRMKKTSEPPAAIWRREIPSYHVQIWRTKQLYICRRFNSTVYFNDAFEVKLEMLKGMHGKSIKEFPFKRPQLAITIADINNKYNVNWRQNHNCWPPAARNNDISNSDFFLSNISWLVI